MYAIECELVVFIIGGGTHTWTCKCVSDKAKGTTIHTVVRVHAILITRLAFYLMLFMLPASDPSLHLSSWVATIWRSASSSLVRRSNWSSYTGKGGLMHEQDATIKENIARFFEMWPGRDLHWKHCDLQGSDPVVKKKSAALSTLSWKTVLQETTLQLWLAGCVQQSDWLEGF